jgi:SAM-dependent methyltransferase
MSSGQQPIDPMALREEVKSKYRDVAANPRGAFHFHTGRRAALRLGYEPGQLEALPEAAVESFAGVANPFSMRTLRPGEKVLDAGSGAGFDCFVAAQQVGSAGRVVGVDMLDAMLEKARSSARAMNLQNVEFREGLIEAMPIEDGWADVVLSNGVINLCVDKEQALREIRRTLRPGGWLQFADIASGREIPTAAVCNIDLWTD